MTPEDLNSVRELHIGSGLVVATSAKADEVEGLLRRADVEAATRAGIGIVALRCGGWDDAALRGARAVYDDPADLLARYETSPFAQTP